MKILLVVMVLLFLSFGSVFAQDEINIGGKAVCRLKGEVPVKKFVADGNRLLLIEEEGITKGSFILQLLKSTKRTLIDFNTLALFGEVSDVDAFLSGKKFNFTSSDSDFMLKVTLLKNDNVLDISNDLSESKGSLAGNIRIKKFENNVVGGNLQFVFRGTALNIIKDERSIEEIDKNGKAILKCNFKDVPIDIK